MKNKIQVADTEIEYTVKRSRKRKKTVQISISGGSVSVAAPARIPESEIQSIILNRAAWILAKLEVSAKEPERIQLVDGDRLPYFGRLVPLVVEIGDSPRLIAELNGEFLGEFLRVEVPVIPEGQERREAVRGALVSLYRADAATFLEESVARWLPAMGRKVMPRVLVREQRSRWGSCSADGTLRFSWRLAMLEPDLIDSVVVHELAHLDVLNHSQAFWDVMLRVMPDAKERRKRLGDAGRNLPL